MPACSPVTEQLTQYHVIPSDNPLSPINHYQTNQSPQFCTIKALRFWLCLPSNLIIAAPEQPPNHDWQASHVYCSLDLTEKKKWDILIVSIIKGPCVFPLIKIKSQYLWNNNGKPRVMKQTISLLLFFISLLFLIFYCNNFHFAIKLIWIFAAAFNYNKWKWNHMKIYNFQKSFSSNLKNIFKNPKIVEWGDQVFITKLNNDIIINNIHLWKNGTHNQTNIENDKITIMTT